MLCQYKFYPVTATFLFSIVLYIVEKLFFFKSYFDFEKKVQNNAKCKKVQKESFSADVQFIIFKDEEH